jgi:hypothetical protein
MKLRLISLALVAAFVGTFVLGATGAAAQPNQTAGAAGVVAAVVQLVATDVIDVEDNEIQVGLVNINRSLNNLRALNNVLNNSPILSNNDIDVVDVIDIGDINVLNDSQIQILTDFLNNNTDLIDAVVGVAVLSTGDLVVFNQN